MALPQPQQLERIGSIPSTSDRQMPFDLKIELHNAHTSPDAVAKEGGNNTPTLYSSCVGVAAIRYVRGHTLGAMRVPSNEISVQSATAALSILCVWRPPRFTTCAVHNNSPGAKLQMFPPLSSLSVQWTLLGCLLDVVAKQLTSLSFSISMAILLLSLFPLL